MTRVETKIEDAKTHRIDQNVSTLDVGIGRIREEVGLLGGEVGEVEAGSCDQGRKEEKVSSEARETR